MQLKYPCFISYCHGQGGLMSGFIKQLVENLNSSIEPYFDECVYYDEDRLRPGYRYNVKLAKAICRSTCMIVVYVPKYENHDYCLREYKAMEIIQERRFELMGWKNPERGMIIPIILRGDVKILPSKIKDLIHFCDFSKFTTASTEICRDRQSVQKLDEIAKYIYKLDKDLEKYGQDIYETCDSFEIPTEAPRLSELSTTDRFPGEWGDY